MRNDFNYKIELINCSFNLLYFLFVFKQCYVYLFLNEQKTTSNSIRSYYIEIITHKIKQNELFVSKVSSILN